MARIKSAIKTVQAVVDNSNPFVVSIPAHESGDLIFVHMNHIGTETKTLTPPGSWTEEFYGLTSNQIITYGWWLLAGGSSESLTVNVTTGTSREWVAHTTVITGVDQTTPIDGSSIVGNVGVPPVGGFDLFPSFSTSVANCLVISTAQIRTSPGQLEALFPGDDVTKIGLEFNPVSGSTNIYGAYQFLDTAGAAVNPVFMPNSTANQRYFFTHVGIRSADSTQRNLRIVPGSAGQIILMPNSGVDSLFGVTRPTNTWPAGATPINGNSVSADTLGAEGAAAYGGMTNMSAIRHDTNNARTGGLARLASPYLDMQNKLFLLDWQMVRSSNTTALDSIANDGLVVVLFSGATEGANWAAWKVGGYPHTPLGSFYQPIVIDPNESSLYLDEGGTFDPSDIRAIGIVASLLSLAAVVMVMFRIADDIAIVGGGTGFSNDPVAFLSDKTFDMGRADFVRQAQAQYRATIPFTIGGTDGIVAVASAFSVEFAVTQDGVARVNNQTLSGRLGVTLRCQSNSIISLTNCIFGGGDYYFNVTDEGTEGTLNLIGMQIINAALIDLDGDFNYSGMSFSNAKSFLDNNRSFDSCTFGVGDLTPANDGMVNWTSNTDISNSRFIAQDSLADGHAIIIETPGTYNFTNLTFTGFGGTAGSNPTANSGSITAAVYNNSGGAVTINVSGGTSPSVRNGASATTVVNAAVTLTVQATGGISLNGAEVRIYDDNGTGRSLGDELDGVESNTGATFVTTAVAPANQIAIQIFLDGYVEFLQAFTMPSVNSTFDAALVPETNE
jgi:hypothetical protein